MSKATPPLTLSARWEEAPPSGRWQSLQSRLAEHAASDASRWLRRSLMSCKWRALPASDSRTRTGKA